MHARRDQVSMWVVRVVAALATVFVAALGAVISYNHLREVARDSGESLHGLYPLVVDGMIVVALAVLLQRSWTSRTRAWREALVPWTVLLLGVAATVMGNVISAEPHLLARVVAAWPPVAFALSLELLLRNIVRIPRRALEDVVAEDVAPASESAVLAPVDQEVVVTPDPDWRTDARWTPVEEAATPAPLDPSPPAPVVPPRPMREEVSPESEMDLDDLVKRTRPLLAQGWGRTKVTRELTRQLGREVSPYWARAAIDRIRAERPVRAVS